MENFIITCSPFFNGKSYLTQFSMYSDNAQDIINYCEKKGIYYKTIVSQKDYNKMYKYQLPLHEL